MAIKKHTGIEVRLEDITGHFSKERPKVIFGGFTPRPREKLTGTFLRVDMPDSTTILTSHN